MDEEVRRYIDAVDPAYRPLFDRMHPLIMAAYPEADVALSYQIPAYKVGKRRLYVGAWQHGISIYGWGQDRDGGFTERHPELRTSKGTIRLRPQDAAAIPDEELSALVGAALRLFCGGGEHGQQPAAVHGQQPVPGAGLVRRQVLADPQYPAATAVRHRKGLVVAAALGPGQFGVRRDAPAGEQPGRGFEARPGHHNPSLGGRAWLSPAAQPGAALALEGLRGGFGCSRVTVADE